MTTVIQTARHRLLREVADDYIRKGYAVQIEPSEEEVPEFLRGFRPDLIITTPEEHIVVEFKATLAEQPDPGQYWSALEDAVKAQPGWRLQLLLDNRRETEWIEAFQPVLTVEETEARLQAGQQLADDGLLDSALIVTWSAVEAVLREAIRREGITLPNQGAAPLITVLYAEGGLARSDYDRLMQILSVRNQAAHGLKVSNLDRSFIDQARDIALRLMKRKHKAA
jgi:hypothetical protein